jgi:hypothetical protein
MPCPKKSGPQGPGVFAFVLMPTARVASAAPIVSPDLERVYAARAHSHTVGIGDARHSVYRSSPKEVQPLPARWRIVSLLTCPIAQIKADVSDLCRFCQQSLR